MLTWAEMEVRNLALKCAEKVVFSRAEEVVLVLEVGCAALDLLFLDDVGQGLLFESLDDVQMSSELFPLLSMLQDRLGMPVLPVAT